VKLTKPEVKFFANHLLVDFEVLDLQERMILKAVFDRAYPGPEGEVILSSFNIDTIEWGCIPISI